MISQFSGILYMNQIKRNNNSVNSRDMCTALRDNQTDISSIIQSLVNPQKRAVLPATLARFYRVKKTWLLRVRMIGTATSSTAAKPDTATLCKVPKNQQRATQKVINRHSKQGKYINIHRVIPAMEVNARYVYSMKQQPSTATWLQVITNNTRQNNPSATKHLNKTTV